MNGRILLVEDEVSIAEGLCDCLRFHDFEVEWQADGERGLAAARHGDFNLVLLDVMLPGLSGFDICQRLRDEGSALAIVMLTAKGSEQDILEGFSRGADDYVCKPFSLKELMARIQAVLRRRGPAATPSIIPDQFDLGPLSIDSNHLTATSATLTADINRRDLEILHVLAEEPGRIVSRRRLLRDIFGYADPDSVETRSVDMHIAKLRKKLAPLLTYGGIDTVRGEGYRWLS
jgi:DNA-binding response OmpR family regulator